MIERPLDFYCAFHLHQPVGNFGEVFESHIRNVYRPLIASLAARPHWPVIVHLSGSLLEWCEQHDHALIDDLARLSSEGRTEFLLAGFYEPVLAALTRDDRLQQIAWMREYILQRFGSRDTGLWLTERVWEPDLARDLPDAGVSYAIVDDRHLLVSGHQRDEMQRCFRTEHDGRTIAILPIDERLRYLIPFKPVNEIVDHLLSERREGKKLAIFADDGEKFGGWPGTLEWVYGSGWMNSFLDAVTALQDDGLIRLVRGPQVLADAPRGGITYIATSSYHEMEGWSLPPELGARHIALVNQLGETRMAGEDNAFIRGAHWKHFLVKYPESNRAHKQMLALSGLCREKGDPPEARRAIGRAQCNDALWHGVFGGLYLPWLREAMWSNLAEAEAMLRRDEALSVVTYDWDCDGNDEIAIHGEHVSVIVAPHRGGAIELYMLLAHRENAADALTRRVEAYHHSAVSAHVESPAHAKSDGTVQMAYDSQGEVQDDAHRSSNAPFADASAQTGAPSIHEIERGNTLAQLPTADLDVRSLIQIRLVDSSLSEQDWQNVRYTPTRSFTTELLTASVIASGPNRAQLTLRPVNHDLEYEVQIEVFQDGRVNYEVNWSGMSMPADSQVLIELSLGARTRVTVECDVANTRWSFPIETIAKSERGLERTVQGLAVAFLVQATEKMASVNFFPPDLQKA